MAIDNTPPRLKLIVTIAVITVITLIGIDFVLKSYYAMMTDQAQREKLAPTTDKDELHKAETVALTSGSMPIQKAMAAVAKGERPALITPQQSDDLGPMTGWSKLPKPAPTPHPVQARAPRRLPPTQVPRTLRRATPARFPSLRSRPPPAMRAALAVTVTTSPKSHRTPLADATP